MNTDPNTLPHHSRDAERALLGSMLRDNLIINDIVPIIKADHFYIYGHQKIYEAITKLNDDGGKAADIVTIAERLIAAGKMDDAGGPGYLAELWDASPSAGAFRQYADTIRAAWTRRQIIHASTDNVADANDLSLTPAEIVERAEQRVMAIADVNTTSSNCTLEQAIRESYDRLDTRTGRRASGERHGVPTGLVDLDDLLCGFQRGELIILAARPSVGKTSMGLQCAAYASVDTKIPTLFVSLEQGRTELADRLLCAYGRVDSYKMRRGHLGTDDQTRLLDAGDLLAKSKLFFDDCPQQNMMRIAANARRMKSRHGVEIVFVDYLQLIDADNHRANRQEQVSAISHRLKGLARELQIPVVAMAQVNRASEDRANSRPKLSDLRESGAIEQDADTVIMLHRTEENHETNTIELIVNKQRNGPTGDAKVLLHKRYMRFENGPQDWRGSE